MHDDVLPPGTAAVASILGQWSAMSAVYLAGDTALALHLRHRQSRDLDFFTRLATGTLPVLPGLDGMLSRFAHVEWDLNTDEQVQWRLDDVSVTLLAYPFRHHFGYHRWRGLQVADARDVAVQKAYAVGRRAVLRDYLDLYAVLTRHIVSLDDIIRMAQDCYHDAFSARLYLQQLTYTQDLVDRDAALSLLVTPQSFDTIAEDLAEQVHDWAVRHLDPPTPPRGGPQP